MTRPGREIEVVGAVILKPGLPKTRREVLIVQRSLSDKGGGLWEFPGGKIEVGEAPEQALVREIEEELVAKIKVLKKIGQHEHNYPELKVMLQLFYAELLSDFKLTEHADYRWIDCDLIDPEILLEADRPFLKLIRSEEV